MKTNTKWSKRFLAAIMTVITLVTSVATANADVVKTSLKYTGANGLEYALFPSDVVYVSQTAYSSYSPS